MYLTNDYVGTYLEYHAFTLTNDFRREWCILICRVKDKKDDKLLDRK